MASSSSVLGMPARASHAAVRMLLALALFSLASVATAQTPNPSRWGLSASFTPRWVSHEPFTSLMIGEGEGEIPGSEFTVGFVRGSRNGGDWGVSYVNKPFEDGATLTESDADCSNNSCYSSQSTRTMRGVRVKGVELHGFFPIVTFKNRFQIGVNAAGGIGTTEGSIEETYDSSSSFTPPNGQTITESYRESVTTPASEVMWKYFPFGKLEVQGSIRVTGGLKIKISGGMNIPDTVSFRVGVVYLFGSS